MRKAAFTFDYAPTRIQEYELETSPLLIFEQNLLKPFSKMLAYTTICVYGNSTSDPKN
jgi:hypothetical protein